LDEEKENDEEVNEYSNNEITMYKYNAYYDMQGSENNQGKQDYVMLQDKNPRNSKAGVPISWIILDNQSMIDVFCNKNLLDNIHTVKTSTQIRCNAGIKVTNLKRYVSGYGLVWHFPKNITNILSLIQVNNRFQGTYNSATGNAFSCTQTRKNVDLQGSHMILLLL